MKISKIMLRNVQTTHLDRSFRDVASLMADIQMHRQPVVNREKRLVGVVSLGNSAASRIERANTTLLQGVAQSH